MTPDAYVLWRYLKPRDDGWRRLRCLYAYLVPRTREVLYIGKAWGVSVRARWRRSGKDAFWDDLERERRILKHVAVIGEILLPRSKRLSHELLCDIESLLIQQVQPWGNIQSRISRTARPGFVVVCRGAWPVRKKVYTDNG